MKITNRQRKQKITALTSFPIINKETEIGIAMMTRDNINFKSADTIEAVLEADKEARSYVSNLG